MQKASPNGLAFIFPESKPFHNIGYVPVIMHVVWVLQLDSPRILIAEANSRLSANHLPTMLESQTSTMYS